MQALRVLGAFLAAAVLLAVAPPPPILRLRPRRRTRRERVDEARFLDLPSAQGALDHAAVFGAHPHYAGTPADHALALYARDRLREYGFEARLEPFEAPWSTRRAGWRSSCTPTAAAYVPRNGAHRARGTPPLGLDLREAGDPLDPPTLDPAVGLPFNAGSADGDVVAPLVYAHRGLPEDYAALARAGVDVRGAVVLVRYGAAFRGLLARNAQNAGAAGAILYDDPADDGAGKGPAYPDGPVAAGGLGAARHARAPGSASRCCRSAPTTRACCCARCAGRAGRPAGPAALDAPYPLAKGPALVHLVVAAQPHDRPRCGTRSACCAARSPRRASCWARTATPGCTAWATTARARSPCSKRRAAWATWRESGWRPKRTLVVALWDGEEIGLLGSAAYARAHAAELRRGCVAYLNADENVTGPRARARRGRRRSGRRWSRRPARWPTRPATRTTLHDRWRAQRGGIAVAPTRAAAATTSRSCSASARRSPSWASRGPFGPYHSSYDTLRYADDLERSGLRAAPHRGAALRRRWRCGWPTPTRCRTPSPPYVPALRAGLLRLQARAQRDGRALDLAPLCAAIDAFAAAARARRRRDRARRRAGRASAALAAAQALDRARLRRERVCRASRIPSSTTAYARGDAAALQAAVAGAVSRASIARRRRGAALDGSRAVSA